MSLKLSKSSEPSSSDKELSVTVNAANSASACTSSSKSSSVTLLVSPWSLLTSSKLCNRFLASPPPDRPSGLVVAEGEDLV